MPTNAKPWLNQSVKNSDPIKPATIVDVDDGSHVDLFDPDEIRRKLVLDYDCSGFEIGEPPALSNDEEACQKRLRQILDDPKNPRRKVLIANEKMITGIAALKMVSPHFKQVVDLIERAATLSLKTQSA